MFFPYMSAQKMCPPSLRSSDTDLVPQRIDIWLPSGVTKFQVAFVDAK